MHCKLKKKKLHIRTVLQDRVTREISSAKNSLQKVNLITGVIYLTFRASLYVTLCKDKLSRGACLMTDPTVTFKKAEAVV